MKKMILSGLMGFYALFGLSADEIRPEDSAITKYRESVEDLSRVRHYPIGYRGEDQTTIFRRILSDAKQDGISNEVVYGLAKEIISEIEQAVSEKNNAAYGSSVPSIYCISWEEHKIPHCFHISRKNVIPLMIKSVKVRRKVM